jgi:hypothetical protein
MPVIDQELVGRIISYKFNTGWHNAQVLQVADGSDIYKYVHRLDGLCGVVPAGKGLMRVHFFDDELDLWVACATGCTADGYMMFNGNRMSSWRMISN